MKKVNCWEFKQCGRQPGGINASELGVCPAAVQGNGGGVNGGENGGRFCWALTGTYCRGDIQGTFAGKIVDCAVCDFYRLVRKEEGKSFRIY